MQAAAAADTLTISFLGHASFLIETPGGVRAVTDYNGYNVPVDPPAIIYAPQDDRRRPPPFPR